MANNGLAGSGKRTCVPSAASVKELGLAFRPQVFMKLHCPQSGVAYAGGKGVGRHGGRPFLIFPLTRAIARFLAGFALQAGMNYHTIWAQPAPARQKMIRYLPESAALRPIWARRAAAAPKGWLIGLLLVLRNGLFS
jgi:hypothetical protein